MVISEFESHTTTKNRIMKVTCKITGKDMTSYLINKWEKEYKANQLQKKIAAKYELDKLLTKLAKENGVTKY